MQATVVKVAVAEGDKVVKGDLVLVLEAMKMEQPITAHKDGMIGLVNAAVGATVVERPPAAGDHRRASRLTPTAVAGVGPDPRSRPGERPGSARPVPLELDDLALVDPLDEPEDRVDHPAGRHEPTRPLARGSR